MVLVNDEERATYKLLFLIFLYRTTNGSFFNIGVIQKLRRMLLLNTPPNLLIAFWRMEFHGWLLDWHGLPGTNISIHSFIVIFLNT